MKPFLFVALMCWFVLPVFAQTTESVHTSQEVKAGAVVINEILGSKGASGFIGAKFIELKNTTDRIIFLKGWRLSDESKKAGVFQEKDYISPGEYLIICHENDRRVLNSFGRTIGIYPWPDPNKDKDKLTLTDEKGNVIHLVDYKKSWYQDNEKADLGGWSLELISMEETIKPAKNWRASKDRFGATPGRINSHIKIDDAKQESELDVVKDDVSKRETINIPAEGELILEDKPKRVTGILKATDEQTGKDVNLREEIAKLDNRQNERAREENEKQEVTKADVPKNSEQAYGDILISEILFDPNKNGAEFVEVYNHSSLPADLRQFRFGIEKDDFINKLYPLSTASYLLHPGQYVVLSKAPEKVQQQYQIQNPHAFLAMPNFPSLSNDRGKLVLLRYDGTRIDELEYAAGLHHAIIKNSKGVSLERTSFKGGSNSGSFRSASARTGFATPGYVNSQYLDHQDPFAENFWLSSKTFSPNGDGFEDMLQLNYQFAEHPGPATVSIYNEYGILVKELLNNQTLDTKGELLWDGLDRYNQKSPLGIYRIVSKITNAQGESQTFLHYCALADRLY